MKKEVEHFKEKALTLEKENGDLQSLVALLEDETIIGFQDGHYSNDVREVIMELLSLNVSMSKVNEVINVVLNKLAKKYIDRLPSAGVKVRLMQEALILGQLQVADAMLEQGKDYSGNCLHGDGTTKYSKHYQTFELSEIVGGDAASTLQCFSETLDYICDVM